MGRHDRNRNAAPAIVAANQQEIGRSALAIPNDNPAIAKHLNNCISGQAVRPKFRFVDIIDFEGLDSYRWHLAPSAHTSILLGRLRRFWHDIVRIASSSQPRR